MRDPAPDTVRARQLVQCGAPVGFLFLLAMPAAAQDFLTAPFIKPGEETLVIDLGGIVNRFDTGVQINGQQLTGSDVDLERNGLPNNKLSFQAVATWRFLSRNRIDVQYFSAKRGGAASNGNVSIRDDTYPLGATVSVEAADKFLIADYRFSFLKTDELELAGLIGVYGGRFEFDFNAAGNAGNVSESTSTRSSTSVPFPLIGVTIDWYLNPRWKIAGSFEGIKAHIGSVDGRAIVATLATDYMLVRNVGVGIRYMYSDLSADISKARFNGTVDWQMSSVSVYAKMVF